LLCGEFVAPPRSATGPKKSLITSLSFATIAKLKIMGQKRGGDVQPAGEGREGGEDFSRKKGKNKFFLRQGKKQRGLESIGGGSLWEKEGWGVKPSVKNSFTVLLRKRTEERWETHRCANPGKEEETKLPYLSRREKGRGIISVIPCLERSHNNND